MRRAIASSVLALSATGLLAACPDRGISKVDPAQGRVEFKDIPVKINRDVDILFVIDDSPSMADKQKNLAANFPNFITELSKIEGGLPNVHIGVVTSDMGTKGADDAAPGPGVGTIGMGGCSGLGKDGNLRTGGASIMNGDVFLSDVLDPTTGMRIKNYSGDLADVFSTMAKAGDGGCGFEQHLEGMKQALVSTNSVNKGFLRDDAFLAVVIIADEDDCSMSHSNLLQSGDNGPLGALQSFRCTRFGVLCDVNGDTTATMNQVGTKVQCHPNDDSAYLTKVSGYADFLKSLKPSDPTKVIVAGIIGTTDPFQVELRAPQGQPNAKKLPSLAHSCSYVDADGKTEVADPPIRIKFFLDQFPNRSTFSTICQSDLSGGLAQIGDLLKSVIGDPCIEGKLADADPKTEGLQADCAVSAVQNEGKDNESSTILPKCTPEDSTATNQPCWHLADDPTNCSQTPDKKTLKIEGQDTLPSDTHVIANCVTQVTDESNPTP